MARYRVMSWRSIPALVKAEDDDGGNASRPMPGRFIEEIDRVAMRDGLVGTDAYLEGWRWSPFSERPGTADEVADAVIRELTLNWGWNAGS